MRAGILEDGVVTVDDRGTGQGSVISPILANIYLHYCFDLWAERWRRQEARGDMIVVRYSFIAVDFHHILLASLRRTHSRCGLHSRAVTNS